MARSFVRITLLTLLILAAGMQPATTQRAVASPAECLIFAGWGTISGTVTNSHGAPLKDVRVFAYTAAGDAAKDTSTDAAGAYTFSNIPTGSYLLSFHPTGASSDQAEWFNHQSGAVSATPVTVNFNMTTVINGQLQPGNQFNLLIQDPHGNPPPESDVTVFDRDGTVVASGVTDNQGYARTSPGLPNGSYRLFVKTPFDSPLLPQYYDHQPTVAAANPITLTAGSGLAPLRVITLDAGARVSGRITDAATGLPIKNAVVSISGANGQSGARSDAQGVYTTTGLPSGLYQVTFRPDAPALQNFAPIQRTITLTAPNLLANFDAALPPGGLISGTVTAPSGTPLAGVTVDATEVHGAFNEAQTDAAGRYTISGLPSGQYALDFHFKAGYIEEFYNDHSDETHVDRVTVTAPNTTANINAVLAPGGWVSGKVADDVNGTPLEHVYVTVIDPRTGAALSSGYTDATGAYTTTASLRSGSYLVRFTPNDDGSSCPHAQTYYHAAVSSATAARVQVSAPGTTGGINEFLELGTRISGAVSDAATGKPLPSAWVIVYDSGGAEVAFGLTNILGRYQIITGLLPGAYRVRFEAYGYAAMFYGGAQTLDAATPITLPDNATNVNVALTRGASIAGRITASDTGQPLERAEVTVYAADGHTVAATQSSFDGSYRFDSTLPSGAYRLGAAPGQTADGIPYFTGYQPAFYGGASTLAAAQPVNLIAPQSATVNIALPRALAQSTARYVYLPLTQR